MKYLTILYVLLSTILFLTVLAFYARSEVTNNNGKATLRWELPTSNPDGSELTDLGGAKIYYGTSSSNYTVVVDAGLTNKTTITNLNMNTLYYFNGTAYSTNGLESDFCNEVAKFPVDINATERPIFLRFIRK